MGDCDAKLSRAGSLEDVDQRNRATSARRVRQVPDAARQWVGKRTSSMRAH